MKRMDGALRNALSITGLLVAGYVFVSTLPDIRRYIRMVRM